MQGRTIWIVIPGQKEEGVPNPGLTPQGRSRTESLGALLPRKPGRILSGTGKRCLQAVEALGLELTGTREVFGTATSSNADGSVTLACGTTLPAGIHQFGGDRQQAIRDELALLPGFSVVIATSPVLKALGIEDPAKATVYLYHPDSKEVRVHPRQPT